MEQKNLKEKSKDLLWSSTPKKILTVFMALFLITFASAITVNYLSNTTTSKVTVTSPFVKDSANGMQGLSYAWSSDPSIDTSVTINAVGGDTLQITQYTKHLGDYDVNVTNEVIVLGHSYNVELTDFDYIYSREYQTVRQDGGQAGWYPYTVIDAGSVVNCYDTAVPRNKICESENNTCVGNVKILNNVCYIDDKDMGNFVENSGNLDNIQTLEVSQGSEVLNQRLFKTNIAIAPDLYNISNVLRP